MELSKLMWLAASHLPWQSSITGDGTMHAYIFSSSKKRIGEETSTDDMLQGLKCLWVTEHLQDRTAIMVVGVVNHTDLTTTWIDLTPWADRTATMIPMEQDQVMVMFPAELVTQERPLSRSSITMAKASILRQELSIHMRLSLQHPEVGARPNMQDTRRIPAVGTARWIASHLFQ